MIKRYLAIAACSLLALFGLPSTETLATSSTSCTVPLVLKDIGKDPSNPEYKLGIYVGLGGGTPMLYEFDTGGKGFWAAYTRNPPASQTQWWGNYFITQGVSLITQYTSGNQYTAKLANTTVGLYSSNGQTFTQECASSLPIGVAQITKFIKKGDSAATQAWKTALAQGQPPLDQYFYGDFGAGLSPVFSTTQNAAIFSALPQLQASTSNGFIVHVGALSSADPSLKIGINDEDRKYFSIVLPMNPYCNASSPSPCTSCQVYFPITGVCAYNEQIVNADIQWVLGNNIQQSFNNIGLTLDTGAPSATIWQNSQLFVKKRFLVDTYSQSGYWNGNFAPGTWVMMNASPPDSKNLNYMVVAGDTKSVNKVAASSRSASNGPLAPKNSGYVNTGLMFFASYDVMFDLEYGVVRLKPLNN